MKRILFIAFGTLILNGCAAAFVEGIPVMGGSRKRPSADALTIARAMDMVILAGLSGCAKVSGPKPPETLPGATQDSIPFPISISGTSSRCGSKAPR